MSIGAHLYWAVYLDPHNPNNRAAIAEVEMRVAIGGANACTGGTPFGPGGTPSDAFDGNASTWWESNSNRAPLSIPRVGYQFPSAVEIAEVVLTNNSNASMISPYGVLAWSDDGTNYTPVAPVFNLSGSASGSVTINGFTETTSGSAVGDGSVPQFGDWAVALAPEPGVTPVGVAASADAWGGDRRVAGTVAIDMPGDAPDTPVHRRVRLYDKASGALMRETWSDATTGAYEFRGVRAGPVIVMAEDYNKVFNVVASDNVLPVL